eukprot:5760168-Amphidinium_carterae.1
MHDSAWHKARDTITSGPAHEKLCTNVAVEMSKTVTVPLSKPIHNCEAIVSPPSELSTTTKELGVAGFAVLPGG